MTAQLWKTCGMLALASALDDPVFVFACLSFFCTLPANLTASDTFYQSNVS